MPKSLFREFDNNNISIIIKCLHRKFVKPQPRSGFVALKPGGVRADEYRHE